MDIFSGCSVHTEIQLGSILYLLKVVPLECLKGMWKSAPDLVVSGFFSDTSSGFFCCFLTPLPFHCINMFILVLLCIAGVLTDVLPFQCVLLQAVKCAVL